MKWFFLLYILSLALPAALLMRPARPARVRRTITAQRSAALVLGGRVHMVRVQFVSAPLARGMVPA